MTDADAPQTLEPVHAGDGEADGKRGPLGWWYSCA